VESRFPRACRREPTAAELFCPQSDAHQRSKNARPGTGAEMSFGNDVASTRIKCMKCDWKCVKNTAADDADLLEENPLDELDGDGTFSDTTRTHHNKLNFDWHAWRL
jgi:hypothetical protein